MKKTISNLISKAESDIKKKSIKHKEGVYTSFVPFYEVHMILRDLKENILKKVK